MRWVGNGDGLKDVILYPLKVEGWRLDVDVGRDPYVRRSVRGSGMNERVRYGNDVVVVLGENVFVEMVVLDVQDAVNAERKWNDLRDEGCVEGLPKDLAFCVERECLDVWFCSLVLDGGWWWVV